MAAIDLPASRLACRSGAASYQSLTQSSTQVLAAQHDGTTAQDGTAWHRAAQHGTTRHGTARHSTAQHGTAQHSTAQHSTAQHSTSAPGPAAERLLHAVDAQSVSSVSDCHCPAVTAPVVASMLCSPALSAPVAASREPLAHLKV